MITYKNFINLLEEKNILLYDFQKRICYHRLTNMSIYQKAGGIQIDDYKIERLITSLLSKDFYVIERLFFLKN
jgi:hypothetical protein